jgi:hypothetical protein
MGMKTIPVATPITLRAEERATLEVLADSRKRESRMRGEARIVRLAAAGLGSRDCARDALHTRHRLEMAGPLRP